MGRPTGFKKSGGFLNDVDGKVADYQFTDEFNGEPFKPGKKADGTGQKFHSLYAVLHARVDGADEDTTVSLFAGGADDFEISEDGHTLTPLADGNAIGAGTPWGKFIQSLLDADDKNVINTEEFFSDSTDDPISFASIIGARVRFGQVAEMGKDGKPKKRIAKKGKFKGKEFDATTTVVNSFYGLEEAEAPKKGAKGTPAKASKGKPAPEESVDVDEVATEALLRYLEGAKDNTLAVGKLKMKAMTDPEFQGKSDLRDKVIKKHRDTDFLEGLDGVTYDEKKETVAIEE